MVTKNINLSEEQIILLSSQHALVKTYRAEIQRLCQTVYDNPNILQSQVEEIQQDPYMPTDLPERISKYPKSISKLAGSHICGVKNRARRDAEEHTPSLYAAVECYIEAVKYAQENLRRSPEAELKYYQRTMNSETLAQMLQKPQPPTQEKKPFSKEEITEQIQQHPVVTRYQAQITHWSKVVFGKKDILQEQVKALLTHPYREAELSWQVEAYPQSFSKLAGLSAFGLKNRTRKQAEAGVSHLANSIENYADVIKQLRESLTQTNQEEYKQHAQLTGLEQSFHKQHSLSETEKQRFPLKLTCRDTTENTKHASGESQDAQRQKVKTSKTLAFAS
ncbi:hypothetical protein ABID23_000666 [Bartonella silvatica]|uniref:Uncharacterized protein n=1 Tax=Bartonella silvatica TaxID=357760 RepID=A0ABV2HHB6_9HYPH